MARPKEIAEGLYHWTAVHPEIHIPVSSYYLAEERVLLNPLLPEPNGLRWLERHGPPEHILLTNRLHTRHSVELVEAFGCTVYCHRSGLSHLSPKLKAKGFRGGDKLPGRIEAVDIGGICADESALVIPRVRAVAVGDGVVRMNNGPISTVPDDLLVDDPRDAPKVKRALKAAYRKLARRKWEHLLLAHGRPLVGNGREALVAWLNTPDSAD